MTVKTKINTEWAVRLLIIAVAALVFGAWFVYDGAVAWPRANDISQTAHYWDESATPPGWVLHDNWQERLAEAGYPASEQPDLPRTQQDINMQFAWAAVCFPVAILLFINLQLHAARKLYADDTGLHYGGKSIAWDQVENIDYDRWDSKGIAIVHASDGRRIKLDDWKYKGAGDVLAAVEQQAPHAARQPRQAAASEEAPAQSDDQPAEESEASEVRSS